MLDTKVIGDRLRELRIRRGMTQDEVAEAVYVSRQAVSGWEKGLALPSISSCILLLDLYHTDLDDLLCLERKSETSALYQDILSGRITLIPSEHMWRMSPAQREQILIRISCGSITVNREELMPYLSKDEQVFLCRRKEDGDEH